MNNKRREIGLKINVLARLLRGDFDKQVAKLNVTRSQWTMIATVSQLPGATQRVIAEALEMSEASAGRLIDRLCAEGLLERRERPDDRRARAVYLTQDAQPLLDDLSAVAEVYEDKMFAGFSDEELDQLQTYLERVYDNVGDGITSAYRRSNGVDQRLGSEIEA